MPRPRLTSSSFYTGEKELRSGYLHKSPPLRLLQSMKSWTRRYFVLTKINEDTYTLKYFKNEKKEKSLGEINVSDISMLTFCPETNSMFGRIHEHFRCPSACVLLLRAGGRDYFLVGENSWEADGWFDALYSVLKSRPDMVSHEDVPRRMSAPPAPLRDKQEPVLADKPRAWSMPLRPPSMELDQGRFAVFPLPQYSTHTLGSQSEVFGPSVNEEPHYAVPRSLKAPVKEMAEDDEKDEGTDSELYEDMASLHEADMKTDDQTPSDSEDSEDSDFYDEHNGPKTQDSSSLTKPVTDERKDKDSGQTRPTSIELEICVSQEDLKKHLNLTGTKRDSLLREGDEILAINDMCIESMQEVEHYLSRIRRNEVTLTIRRLSGELQAMKLDTI